MVDSLIPDRSLTGPKLVNSIRKLDPSLSVEDVLELTRYVNLQRILEDVRNVFEPHVILYLRERGLTVEDTDTVFKWYSPTSKLDVSNTPSKKSSPWWRRALRCTRSRQGTDPEPSGK